MTNQNKLYILLTLAVAGCVTPPPKVDSRVHSSSDLATISHSDKGQKFALNGRLDLAEREFRSALLIRPDLAALYADLGFVLVGQARFEEAIRFLTKSVQLDPNQPAAYETLARALYGLGRTEQTKKVYDKIIIEFSPVGLTNLEGSEAFENLDKKKYTNEQIGAIYRNLSVIYYNEGDLSMAICFLGLAAAIDGNPFNRGAYARLLLSVNRIADAEAYLKGIVTAPGAAPDSSFFLDYGISLLAGNKVELSAQAFSKVLSSQITVTDPQGTPLPAANQNQRKLALIFKLLIYKGLNNPEESHATLEQLEEEDENWCDDMLEVENKHYDLPDYNYWPQEIIESVHRLISEVCVNEKQHARK